MLRTLSLFLILCASVHLSRAETSTVSTWGEASLLSEKTGKPVMIVFTGKQGNGQFWCPPCRTLDEAVFQTGDFKEWSKDRVVLLEVILPTNGWPSESMKAHNMGLSEKYEIQFVPTVIFTDSTGKQIGANPKKQNVAAWIADADSMLASEG